MLQPSHAHLRHCHYSLLKENAELEVKGMLHMVRHLHLIEKSVCLVVASAVVLAAILGHNGIVRAQSPMPSNLAVDYPANTTITTLPSGVDVAVIQGLASGVGPGGCQTTNPSEIANTADRLMGRGIRTIVEVTPQSGCSSNVADWENVLATITNDISTSPNSPGVTVIPYYWFGFMLDEEDGFWSGGGAKQFEQLNEFASTLMAHTYGVAWFYTEDFTSALSPGSWTQMQYNDIVHNDGHSIPAPQVYNSNMVGYVNAEQSKYNDTIFVTWDCYYKDSDYNTASAATGQINGPPYIAPDDVSLSNEFVGGNNCH